MIQFVSTVMYLFKLNNGNGSLMEAEHTRLVSYTF